MTTLPLVRDYDEACAAHLLGVSIVTLRRWRRKAAIGHYRLPGGRIRYSPEQLEQFRHSCLVPPVAPPITDDHA